MTTPQQYSQRSSLVEASVVSNEQLCKEHYLITMAIADLPDANPGQFVHLGRAEEPDAPPSPMMLRRAFSIAALRRTAAEVQVDVIYRVVGRGTHWLSTLRKNDGLSLLGPLGKPFPIPQTTSTAYLVAGGVGLPPLMWLAETLPDTVSPILFCGSQTRELMPLLGLGVEPIPNSGSTASQTTCPHFTLKGKPVAVSTDDGTLGHVGHVGSAFVDYLAASPPFSQDVVVYTCGPDRMMKFVAEQCEQRGWPCYVCLERTMACGMGTCQSCVVSIKDETDADGWRYKLCCSDGPVFDSKSVIWPEE